ncbi:MAG TPA: hypothetical protein VIR59_03010 [Gaiellaceae bacterium]
MPRTAKPVSARTSAIHPHGVSLEDVGSLAVVVGVTAGAGAVVVAGTVDVVEVSVTVSCGRVGVGVVGRGAVVVTSTVVVATVGAASAVTGDVGCATVGCDRVAVSPVRVLNALLAPPPPPHAPRRKPATPASTRAPATRT